MSSSSQSSTGGFGLAAANTTSDGDTIRGSLLVSSTSETTLQDSGSSGGGSAGGAAAESSSRPLSAVKEEEGHTSPLSERGGASVPPTSSSSSWVMTNQSPLVGDGWVTPSPSPIIEVIASDDENETDEQRTDRLLGIIPVKCQEENISDEDLPPVDHSQAQPVPHAPLTPPRGRREGTTGW